MTSPSASSPSHTLGQKSTLDYTEDYGYDPLYRLTRADRTNPGPTPPNQWTWSYDAVGNRTSAQKDQEATSSSYNEKNQLLQTTGGGKMLWRGVLDEPGLATFNAASASINGHPARMLAGNVFEATLDLPAGANTVTIQAQDGSGNTASQSYSVNVIGVPATYTYDANGNLATKTEGADAWVYTWNALNQLTAVTKNGATVASYGLDPRGRRIERTVGSTANSWTYDREDVIRLSAGTGGNAVSTKVVHGPGVDAPLAEEDATSGSVVYLQVDGLGSVVRHTNGAGAATETLAYDTWGTIQSGVPSVYSFTGREWDASVGLYYYRARYYDAAAGRFISEDPLGLGDGPNRFAYVHDNPAALADPWGLAAEVPNPLGCDKICTIVNRDRRFTHDSDGEPVGGTVICWNGKKCPCAFDRPGARRGECPLYDAVVEDHESGHIPFTKPCTANTCETAQGTSPQAMQDSECAEYYKDVGRLLQIMSQSTGNCKKAVEQAFADKINAVKWCKSRR